MADPDRLEQVPPHRWWCQAETVAAAVAIACYINVLPNDFCYDDNLIVRHSAKVNDPGQWGAIWTTDHWGNSPDDAPNRDLLYRPVSLSSHRLVRIVAGIHPLPHHLFNLILHALISALIARLCRHIGGGQTAALISGVTFAVLPIHTEVIASVVGRADLLATLGVLLTLLAHRRSLDAVTRPGVGIWRVTATFTAFTAMGAKESGLSIIPLTVLLDALWYYRSRAATNRAGWFSRRTVARLAYLLIPLTLYLGLRYYALGERLYQTPPLTKTVNVLVDAPPWQQALGVLQLWGMYWAKTVWPVVLTIKYSINGIRLATSVADRHVLIGILALVGLIGASAHAWRKGVYSVAVLSAAVVLSYLPTANALMLIQVFFAERIWYLPSAWVAILAGLAAAPRLRRPGLRVALAVLAIGMTARCWIRNVEWKDNGTLYAAAFADQPEAAGPLHLFGEWLVDHGQYKRGVELLNRAVEIDLGFTDAHRTLGEAHLGAGRLRVALHHLQIADMQVPGHPPTATALERVSRELASHDQNLNHLQRQAERNPGDVVVEVALVRKLRELGQTRDALARLRRSETRFAYHAAWQAEYAVTLVYLNELDLAIERYRQSLTLEPDNPQRAVELVGLLCERREGDDLERAWKWTTHAETLAPGAPSVLACRAQLLALRGDIAGAAAYYRKAIVALPPHSRERRVFEERAKALGD